MSSYTSGTMVDGAQAHIRALAEDDDIKAIIDETRDRFGHIAFAYRRGEEVDVSDVTGRDMFAVMCTACLDKVLLIVTGNLSCAVERCRELLEELGALSPRKPAKSNSKVFDFGAIKPHAEAKTHKKLGPNHFLANQETASAPSRVFSSTNADPQGWMNNHLVLQSLTKKDICALRILKKPHPLVMRSIEVVALLTGRGARPFPLFSVLAPAVLTDDVLTELLLLQKQMVPPADLRRVTGMLKNLDSKAVMRINTTAGVLVDWATAVTTNVYPSSAAPTFKHGIFARADDSNGIACIPVPLKNRARRMIADRPR